MAPKSKFGDTHSRWPFFRRNFKRINLSLKTVFLHKTIHFLKALFTGFLMVAWMLVRVELWSNDLNVNECISATQKRSTKCWLSTTIAIRRRPNLYTSELSCCYWFGNNRVQLQPLAAVISTAHFVYHVKPMASDTLGLYDELNDLLPTDMHANEYEIRNQCIIIPYSRE